MSHLPIRSLHSVEYSTPASKSLAGAEGDAPAPSRPRPRSFVVRPLLALFALALTVLTSSAALAVEPEDDGEWSDESGEWLDLAAELSGFDSESSALASDFDSESSSSCVCGVNTTLATGQAKIDQGQYWDAVDIFTCVIDDAPLTVDAYRGRSEAYLMLGRYADALADYSRLTAVVAPTNPTYGATINAGYDARLTSNPWNVRALAGASFARWCFYDMAGALPLVQRLIALRPYSVYANLFRGSNRLFVGVDVVAGKADFDRAISYQPYNAHVRYIVADGYTYAAPNLTRASTEATYALNWGLNTPRVRAILAAAQLAAGNVSGAAANIQQHLNLVTTQTAVITSALGIGTSTTLALVPGKTYEIPFSAINGQTVSLRTSSPSQEIFDSIFVVLNSAGTPVTGSDDYIDFYAGLDWVAPATGTYKIRVTSFESVGTGGLVVTRN